MSDDANATVRRHAEAWATRKRAGAGYMDHFDDDCLAEYGQDLVEWIRRHDGSGDPGTFWLLFQPGGKFGKPLPLTPQQLADEFTEKHVSDGERPWLADAFVWFEEQRKAGR